MTTLLERHAGKLEAEEDALANVYRAGLAWVPAGRAALEAGAKLEHAQREVQTAQSETGRILAGIEERNRELGAELARLHNAGTLIRENIGEGGGRRIKDLLDAETKLRKAREVFTEAKDRSSDAAQASNLLFRDEVYWALDALKPHVSFETHQAVAQVFEDARKDPGRVADSCKTRLQVLGVK